MSVSPSARKKQRDSRWKDFRQITYVGRLQNSVDFVIFCCSSSMTQNDKHFTRRPMYNTTPRRYWSKDLSVLREVRAQTEHS
jgi:hypothetical protein